MFRKRPLLRSLTHLLLFVLLFILLFPSKPSPAQTSFINQALSITETETSSPALQTIQSYARANGYSLSDWPSSLLELLERNPETEDFVLSYPAEHDKPHTVDLTADLQQEDMPLFLQWDKRWGYLPYGKDLAALTACGPVCLSMVAFHLTGDVNLSPDRIISFALENGYCSPGNGSSWTLISQGAEKLGLTATELPLVKQKIFDQLEAGNPVICVMGPGDFTTTGHFIVLTSLEDGLLCVNDPNSRANSEKRWDFDDISDQIRNLWALNV